MKIFRFFSARSLSLNPRCRKWFKSCCGVCELFWRDPEIVFKGAFASGIRGWVCVLSTLFLSACTPQLNFTQSQTDLPPEPPRVLALEDASGNVLGAASVLRPQVLVGPDHVLQQEPELFVADQAIKVLARDFRHDVFFFTVPAAKFVAASWAKQPPGVGQTLWWSEIDAAAVFSARAQLRLGNTELENLMSLDTVTQPGDSGKPLYNPKTGRVFGMLVASDAINEVSYFVRSDIVLRLASEYLD